MSVSQIMCQVKMENLLLIIKENDFKLTYDSGDVSTSTTYIFFNTLNINLFKTKNSTVLITWHFLFCREKFKLLKISSILMLVITKLPETILETFFNKHGSKRFYWCHGIKAILILHQYKEI